jgi:hypothetical protein
VGSFPQFCNPKPDKTLALRKSLPTSLCQREEATSSP